jgi:uncharacterized membrane protein
MLEKLKEQVNISNPDKVNVNDVERWVSALAGGALTTLGVRRRDHMSGPILALLGAALVKRGLTGHCDVYQALGLSSSHSTPRSPGASVDGSRAVRVDESVTIHLPRATVYKFWRNFENFPGFMEHLQSVTETSEKQSHWVAKAPLGRTIEWDAEIINDVPNDRIGWRSLPGSDVMHAGSVRFKEAPNGSTIVDVTVEYEVPGGVIADTMARLLGQAPSQQIRKDLESFKALMESGEVTTVAKPIQG